jgi:hypothetical protein
MKYDNLNEEQKEGAGCMVFAAFSLFILVAAFVVGGLFGWFWGVAFYFGAVGLLCTYLVTLALKG